MKLVQLLATKLDKWADTTVCYVQDSDGSVWPCTEKPNCQGVSWVGSGNFIDQSEKAEMLYLDISDDNCTTIVTRAQWQAERDRQKGGEWKRHRGGKCPVPAGTKVSTRHRSGEVVDVHFHTATTGSGPATMNAIWKHTGDDHDIMAYKVISQPQAEEVEAKRNAAKDADVEYAFGAPDADMSNLDWKPMGKCKVSNIEFDSAEMEKERVKDTTVGTLTYKVDIDTGPAMQALNELSAKWDQMETPFKWRDEVTELNAYIEKFTREREALIERLASEGFALIQKINLNLDKIDATMDMSDWRNWEAGDVVECTHSDCTSVYTAGNYYKVTSVTSEYAKVSDDCGPESFCHINDDDNVKFTLYT